MKLKFIADIHISPLTVNELKKNGYDIMRSRFIKRRYELIWFLVIFLVPFGVIVYFAFGKKHKTGKNTENILR